jgi:hypothetical protein
MPIAAEVMPILIIMAAANRPIELVYLRGKPVMQQLLIVLSSRRRKPHEGISRRNDVVIVRTCGGRADIGARMFADRPHLER